MSSEAGGQLLHWEQFSHRTQCKFKWLSFSSKTRKEMIMNTKRSLKAVTLVALSTTLFTLIATTKPLPAKAQADLSRQIVSVQSVGGLGSHPFSFANQTSGDVRHYVRIRKIGVAWNIFMK
jgi:hypothetical protein